MLDGSLGDDGNREAFVGSHNMHMEIQKQGLEDELRMKLEAVVSKLILEQAD